MLGFIIRRVFAGILVLITVSMLTFALFFFGPGDPALAQCPPDKCTPQRLELIRDSLNLDDPVPQQYAEYMAGIFVGNDFEAGATAIECPAPCFGVSFVLRQPVWEYLKARFPATLSLAGGAAVVFLTVGVTAGIVAARKRGTLVDKTLVGTTLVLNAMPYYVLALLSFIYLVLVWGVVPTPEYRSPFEEGWWSWFTGLLLPWFVLGMVYSTQYARFGRGAMVEALGEDYVRTARAKGLAERTVTFRHAFRAAIVPIVTIFGLDMASLLAGTIFTEKVFNIHGIGIAAVDAINQQDLPIISATVLIAAAFVIVANVLVDLLYGFLDPRVRLG